MVTNEEVGRRIRQARGEMGWNQAELGRQLVPSRSHAAVSDIERGKTKLDVEDLSAIAVLLKKPLEYFIPTRATPSLTYQRSDRDLSAEQQQKGLSRSRRGQSAPKRPGSTIEAPLSVSATDSAGTRVLIVAVPWPPTVNTYYRHVVVKGGARVLLSAAGRAYQRAVCLVMAGRSAPPPPHAVRVVLHAPDRRAYDIDNRAKALLDGVYRALDIDDGAIDRLEIVRGGRYPGGCALVVIEGMS